MASSSRSSLTIQFCLFVTLYLLGCIIVIPSSSDEVAKVETGEQTGEESRDHRGDGLRVRIALLGCLAAPSPPVSSDDVVSCRAAARLACGLVG